MIVPRPSVEVSTPASSNYFHNVADHPKLFIVCHTMEGTYDGCKAWFANEQAQACSNFGVARDRRIAMFIDPDGPNSPYANGVIQSPDATAVYWLNKVGGRNLNLMSLSIEHEDNGTPGLPLTDVQLELSSQLSAYYIQRYEMAADSAATLDSRTILGHFQIESIDRAHCPGWSLAQWQAYEAAVMQWLGQSQPVPDPCADLRQQLAAANAQIKTLASQLGVLQFNSNLAMMLIQGRDADVQTALDKLAQQLKGG